MKNYETYRLEVIKNAINFSDKLGVLIDEFYNSLNNPTLFNLYVISDEEKSRLIKINTGTTEEMFINIKGLNVCLINTTFSFEPLLSFQHLFYQDED